MSKVECLMLKYVSPPVHLSSHLSVTFYQQLYRLSDFHQIQYRSCLLKLSGKYEFRENWFSGSHICLRA